MPQEDQNDNFSVAKCRIYLNPCCKFELVSFLKTYLRNFINLDHGVTPDDQGYLKCYRELSTPSNKQIGFNLDFGTHCSFQAFSWRRLPILTSSTKLN